MKKNTTKIAIVFMVIIVGVVGLYTYLSTKQRQNQQEAKMTAVQLALSRDLENDYPSTVKQVVTYFMEIQTCLYNEECTEGEIEQLGMQARKLFDDDLLDNNEVGTYLQRLKAEIADFQNKKRKIHSSSKTADSNNVETFQEDGYEFARIHSSYYIAEGGRLSSYQDVVYLLRRDGNRRWKIYGWDRAESEEITE